MSLIESWKMRLIRIFVDCVHCAYHHQVSSNNHLHKSILQIDQTLSGYRRDKVLVPELLKIKSETIHLLVLIGGPINAFPIGPLQK